MTEHYGRGDGPRCERTGTFTSGQKHFLSITQLCLAMHRTVACERVIPRDLDLRRLNKCQLTVLRHWVKTAMIGSGAQASERI
jgi:hypothetical protein